MTTVVLEGPKARASVSGLLAACILVSAALAYVLPYDRGLSWLTLNSRALGAAAMVVIWIAGLQLQRLNGYALHVTGFRRPAPSLVLIAASVALWCLALDLFVFRSVIPSQYVAVVHQPLALRLAYYCTRAINENVLYRLFLGSLFIWLIRVVWPGRSSGLVVALLGMGLAQAVNIWVNFVPVAPTDGVTLIWIALRFLAPAVVCGWVYVRHGFAANEAVAVGAHLFLQPLVSVAL